MRTAKQSREKAFQKVDMEVKYELAAIEQMIEDSIKNAELDIFTDGDLLPKTKIILKDLGYELSDGSHQMDKTSVKISW